MRFSVFIHLICTVLINLQTYTNDKINDIHLHASEMHSAFWTDVKKEQGIKKKTTQYYD